MEPHRTYSLPLPALTSSRPFSGSASDLSCHLPAITEQKSDEHDLATNLATIKYSQVVMVNEHKESDDDKDSNKKSKQFWKRNRKRNSKNIGSNNPSANILILSTRKQHKSQALGLSLRQQTSGVFLLGIAPHSPFRAASRFVPHGSKLLLVNGQPCPQSVKEVATRLANVPAGAVTTLHFEVDNKPPPTKKSSSKLSLFRRSSNNSSGLNPVDVGTREKGGPDYAFSHNMRCLQQHKLPPSILKTPKYSKGALVSGGCHTVPSAMHMLMQTASLPYQAAKILGNEAVSELDQLGKFFSSWTGASTPRFECTDVTMNLLEQTNTRWSSIKADELAEF